MTIDDRKAAVLRAVIEQYVETAQPVGSGAVARAPGVEVSSATVRSDMGTLEDEGYLEQPYTSAGRIPTEKSAPLAIRLRDVKIGGVEVFVEPVKEHRFVVVFRGSGLDSPCKHQAWGREFPRP